MYMYMYVYIYIYICIYVCMYVCIYIYIYPNICVYIYIYVYMRAYVHIFHVFTISKSSPPVSMSSGMIWSFYRLEAYHNISSTSLAFYRVYSVQYISGMHPSHRQVPTELCLVEYPQLTPVIYMDISALASMDWWRFQGKAAGKICRKTQNFRSILRKINPMKLSPRNLTLTIPHLSHCLLSYTNSISHSHRPPNALKKWRKVRSG